MVVAGSDRGEGSEGEGALDLADRVVEDRLLREPGKLSLMEKNTKKLEQSKLTMTVIFADKLWGFIVPSVSP